MIGITQAQHHEAMQASALLTEAASLIQAGLSCLVFVPERFRPQMHEAMRAGVDDGLSEALSSLADRIALDADQAAERTE